MKKFSWQGIDINGFKTKGLLEAKNAQHARTILLQQKITPLKITRHFELTFFSSKNRITSQDITDLSIEFSTLISADIPLSTSLNIMTNSTDKHAMKNLIITIQQQVENGCLLSEALQSQKKYFDAFFCNLVYAGEHSGTLELALKNIATHREKIVTLKKKIKKALFYPCIVLITALAVSYAMLVFVIPQFERLFHSTGAELPALTQLVIRSAQIAQQYGGLLFFTLISIIVSLYLAIKHFPRWRYFFDCWILKLPVVGKILLGTIFTRCFSTLSTTLRAGLPLLDALQLTANIAGNQLYKQGFAEISQQAKNGQMLHTALKNTKLFSPRIIQMVRIGEESGRLDYMLQKLSEYFSEQADDKVHHLSQLLEPALMIFLCLLVGTLVIAMYLPIFRLGSVL